MSMNDDGYGLEADPPLDLQSNFASSQSVGSAPGGEPWGMNSHKLHTSEVSNMDSGASKPGQPVIGQRSIFGGGRPAFAQMPAYTPVTRGPGQSAQPAQAPQPEQGYGNPLAAAPEAYQPARQGMNGNHGDAAYGSNGHARSQDFPGERYAQERPYGGQTYAPQAYPSPSYPPQQSQAEGYAPQGHAVPNHQVQEPARQPYGNGYANQGYANQGYPNQPYPQQGYPAQQQGYPAPNYPAQAYGNQPDASFAEPSAPQPGGYSPDAHNGSFADASFPEEPASPVSSYGHDQPLDLGMPNGNFYAGGEIRQGLNDGAMQNFGTVPIDPAVGPYGGQADPHRAIAAFDAPYDQPPQIALGATDPARHNMQGFYESEHADASFLDDGQGVSAGAIQAKAARKFTVNRRSLFMVGSALLGAVALGGALAFAYKQSGGITSGQPPIVQADATPVKEAPDQGTSAADPAHKTKLIYDRLQNDDQTAENDHIVPRQEDLAVPNMPGASDPSATASAQNGAPGQGIPADPAAGPPQVASVDDPDASGDGGPRKVKTMLVRPDGSMVAPPADAGQNGARTAGIMPAQAAQPQAQPVQARFAAAGAAAPPAAAPAAAPTADNADSDQVAAIPQAAPPPQPKPKAAKPQQVASATPAPAAKASSGPSQFVVQVGSKKNQTEALASFADMQQKYPTLLANYRPIVQKADLGSKGVWYRLRIGPITDKSSAAKLCSQLKSQGMSDCLVMTE